MKRFDWFIIRKLLSAYAILIGLLIVFFVVVHYSESMDDFHDRGAGTRDIFLVYYPSYIPDIIRLVSPLALFLGCIFWTARLAQSLQLVALHGSGVSLARIARPYLVVGIGITLFMFGFNGWVVPQTNRTVLAFEQEFLREAARSVTTSDIHRQESPGRILSVSYFDRSNDTAHLVSLQQFDESNQLVYRIDAPRMQWVDSLDVWRFREPVEWRFDDAGLISRHRSSSIDTTLTLLPSDLARTERDIESMTITGASEYINELRRSGVAELNRTLVAYYDKFAYPFANLVLVVIALPLASVRRRGGQAVQIGIGLAVAFSYLALQKLIEPFGYAGELSPVAAAWVPHIVFGVVALILMMRHHR